MYLTTSSRAMEESARFTKTFKQPTPESITPDELLQFNLRAEFDALKHNCPLLFHVVSGAMGLSQSQSEVHDHWLKLFDTYPSLGSDSLLTWGNPF